MPTANDVPTSFLGIATEPQPDRPIRPAERMLVLLSDPRVRVDELDHRSHGRPNGIGATPASRRVGMPHAGWPADTGVHSGTQRDSLGQSGIGAILQVLITTAVAMAGRFTWPPPRRVGARKRPMPRAGGTPGLRRETGKMPVELTGGTPVLRTAPGGTNRAGHTDKQTTSRRDLRGTCPCHPLARHCVPRRGGVGFPGDPGRMRGNHAEGTDRNGRWEDRVARLR